MPLPLPNLDTRRWVDLTDDRWQCQSAAMTIAGQRAAEAEAIGAGLLLMDAPGQGESSL